MENKDCFINGKWVDTSQRLKVASPWSGEVVGEVSLAGAAEWEAAIVAAEAAAVTLRKLSSLERRQMLEALVAGVKERQAELAQTIMSEGGKPITFARGEVSRGLMTLALAAEEAERLGGEVLPLDQTRARAPARGGTPRRAPAAGCWGEALNYNTGARGAKSRGGPRWLRPWPRATLSSSSRRPPVR